MRAEERHVFGFIYAILEALGNAATVHVENAPHGTFVKAHRCKKQLGSSVQSHGSISTAFPPSACSTSLDSLGALMLAVYSKATLLDHRPQSRSSIGSQFDKDKAEHGDYHDNAASTSVCSADVRTEKAKVFILGMIVLI